MKLYEAGKPNESLLRLLNENVRNGEQVLGDLHSFVAANALGAERLLAFMSDYGMHDLRALAAVVQGRSEKAMRDAERQRDRLLDQLARQAEALAGERQSGKRLH